MLWIQTKQNIKAFNDMIADMICNRKLNLILIELFIRRRKLHISTAFISYNKKTTHFYCFYHTILLRSTKNSKYKTNESFNKSQLIIHRIMTVNTFAIFTKSVLQNHILF